MNKHGENVKTFVTGGTGFIGRHLVKRLVEEGRSVRCLVRKTSDVQFLDKLGVELCYGDLLDNNLLKNIFEDQSINIVYHLGGSVYSRRSSSYHQVNVIGTDNLLRVCTRSKIEKFILVSSITAVGPQTEKDDILTEETTPHPIPPYGTSKNAAEKVALQYCGNGHLPLVIVRPPLVYGPGQGQDMTNIFKQIERGVFRIIGTGDYITSLCYIDNLIDGLLLVEKHKDSIRKIYFIADNRYYTFKEIAEAIAKELGVRLSNVKIPKFVGDISGVLYKAFHNIFGITSITLYALKLMTLNFACDISKVRNELSYHPKIDFYEGIRRTSEWYKKNWLN